MRLEQLRYLSDIRHTNSISKTAHRFFLSQQSLSSNIKQLEKELKVPLLERSPFGVVLTEEAESLLSLSDPFLLQYDLLQEQFALQQQNQCEDLPNRIRIYSSSVLASTLLPQAVAIFVKKYPKVKISIKEVNHNEIFPAIIDNKCSLTFLSINEDYFLKQLNIYDSAMFHYHIMLTDRLVGCISSKSALAKKEVIEQTDMVNRLFTYLNIVPIKDALNHPRQGVALYTSNNVEFHRRILRELDIISLMPRYVYTNLFDSKYFVAKPLEGAQQVIYHAVLYPNNSPHSVIKELGNLVTSLV